MNIKYLVSFYFTFAGKIGLAIVLCLFTGIMGYLFMLLPLDKTISENQHLLMKYQLEIKESYRSINTLNQEINHLIALHPIVQSINLSEINIDIDIQTLIEKTESVLTHIENKMTQDIISNNEDSEKDEKITTHQRQRWLLRFTLSFQQILQILTLITYQLPNLNIENLAITPLSIQGEHNLQLEVELVQVFYTVTL